PDADNVLLEERDRAITTQAERIKLLTEAHGKVYGEVDSLEAEITKLQQRLVDKEGEAMKYKVEGREFAMDQATKQNTELLKLLQEAEQAKEE
ncbi:unnamed protein product, partial [Symbiodinium sp. KB8]